MSIWSVLCTINIYEKITREGERLYWENEIGKCQYILESGFKGKKWNLIGIETFVGKEFLEFAKCIAVRENSYTGNRIFEKIEIFWIFISTHVWSRQNLIISEDRPSTHLGFFWIMIFFLRFLFFLNFDH